MPGEDLLAHLRDLEVALHQPGVRSNIVRLDELLHQSFAEFGRSGASYTRADILSELFKERPLEEVWSQDFSLWLKSPMASLYSRISQPAWTEMARIHGTL